MASDAVIVAASPQQNRLIADVLTTHGVEFYRGMLIARCRPDDQLAEVVTRVAQAALRVSDLWFTLRTRAVESIADEVADYLTERELPRTFRETDRSLGARLDRGLSRSYPRAQLFGLCVEHGESFRSEQNDGTRAGCLARFASSCGRTRGVESPFSMMSPMSGHTRTSG